jgi:hypothetical protein
MPRMICLLPKEQVRDNIDLATAEYGTAILVDKVKRKIMPFPRILNTDYATLVKK